jgi:uncharacterized membrane protein (UPF0182 family)
MASVSMRVPRQRRWPAIVVAVLAILIVLFTVASQFYIDLLWYREVDLGSVFWTTLSSKVLLGLAFGLVFFLLLYVNLVIVRRIKPQTRALTPDQEIVERIRQQFEPMLRWLLPLGCALLALFVGIGVGRQWQTFLLWKSSAGIDFGNPEPLFGRDPSFYVFSLPWLKFVQGWLFSTLVAVTFLVGLAHFLWGGIRPQAPLLADKVMPAARAHLSVLLGLIMLVKAWGYYLGRFDLLNSPRGVVQGASYTDVNAQLPALNFLAIVAVICAILFFVNIRLRIWALPIVAVLLLAVVSVLLGTAYPAFVQRFRVAPQEYQREQEYIGYNIEGTRRAFGLDTVDVVNRPVDPLLTARDVKDNPTTIQNIRLWRQGILQENFQSSQRIRQYYEFKDVDVDRYTLASGDRRVLMLAAREVTQAGIPSQARTWQNEHLVYTHGFGAVAAQVNQATTEGAPVLTVRDIPPVGEPVADQPRIYFGEVEDVPFVITNTGTPELDYEGAPTTDRYVYDGTGGIPMGNVLQRALFAWRFRDVNLLISGQLDASSRIMLYRDIQTRATKAVPFLTFDSDPYLSIVDGQPMWIWDAYTTTNQYPYSESVNLTDATDGLLAGSGDVNYIRNSVKVVADAYNGTLTYYADDGPDGDPIVRAWAAAFPDLFTSIADAPQALREHFRYPENLFQTQATQFANYHVTDTEVFYQKQDFWQIPEDPTTAQNLTGTTTIANRRIRPYYLLLKTPGDPTERFQLVLPLVPEGRPNLVSWMAADSDPENYGQTVAFTFPSGTNVEGPAQIFSRINQNPQFSAERSLLDQGGSSVQFGDLLVIPLNDAFLWVQPVYVRSAQTQAVPELKRVVVVNGTTVGVGNTLADALAASVEGQVPGGGGGGGGGGGEPVGTISQRVAALLDEALRHFTLADAALKAGDLATYQDELSQAQDLVQQANDLAAQEAGGVTSSATPSASASASP